MIVQLAAKVAQRTLKKKAQGAARRAALKKVGGANVSNTGSTRPATMPASRFWLMIGAALMFDFGQLIVGILFLSPSISAAILGAAGGAATCSAIFSLGNTICGIMGTVTGAFSATFTGALDAVAAGSLTAFSNSVGQVVGSVISICASVCFSIWYMLSGISLLSGKRATKRFAGFMVQSVAELIPFVGALPLVTVSVAYVCTQAKLEDKENAART